jgi:hypothetical protein
MASSREPCCWRRAPVSNSPPLFPGFLEEILIQSRYWYRGHHREPRQVRLLQSDLAAPEQ